MGTSNPANLDRGLSKRKRDREGCAHDHETRNREYSRITSSERHCRRLSVDIPSLRFLWRMGVSSGEKHQPFSVDSNKIRRLVKRRWWSDFLVDEHEQRSQRSAESGRESGISDFNISTINPHPGPFTTYDGINNKAAIRTVSLREQFLLLSVVRSD